VNGPSRQRHERILAEVLEKRHVTARDLALNMDVSEATVRRDLKAMAEDGQIELVYGGATIRRPSDFSFRSKSTRNIEAKRIIGRLAAELVTDDEQIFIDSGTTCFEMTPFLKRRRGLSTIVSSARLALELDAPGLSVIMLGGQYRPDRMDAVGPLATSTLDQLRGYVCFVGADGLSMDFGPAAADIQSANLYRRAVQNSRSAVLLVDHTKFEAASLFKIVEWEAIKRLVTDQKPASEWMDFLAARGIEVIHPPATHDDR
jgi:DeoR/GlpR family transcriptional regulator of sugar metabolism